MAAPSPSALKSLRKELDQLKDLLASQQAVALPDPVSWAAQVGFASLDPWQARILTEASSRVLMLCARQTGKSTAASLLGAYLAMGQPGLKIALISPTFRQSKNLADRTMAAIDLTRPKVVPVTRNADFVMLPNGSSIRILPGSPDTVRGLSIDVLIVDEAAFLANGSEFMAAVLPMIGASQRGRIILLSTPCGPTGPFYEAWISEDQWTRIRVTASESSRLSPEFVEESRRRLGDQLWRQEFMAEFVQSLDSFFDSSLIDNIFGAETDEKALIDDEEDILEPFFPA